MSVLLTIPEAAAHLRVSTRTVYRLIAEKQLRATKVRGSRFIIDTELERYLRGAGRVA